MDIDALSELHQLDARARRASRIAAVLQWDQETYLPPAAVEERSEQLADIEGVAHERASDPKIGLLLDRLGSTSENPLGDEALSSFERAFLRVMRRDYDRATKLPREFVETMARDVGLSQAAWASARATDDFPSFAPHLRSMVRHAKKLAEYLGCGDKPYDCHIDHHEPGMDEAKIASLFGPLSDGLSSLLGKIASRPAPDASFLSRNYPVDAQEAFCSSIMDLLGYDRKRGRLDRSAHPFTTTLGDDDVRITTRYFPKNMLSGLYSVIHETGHALYEQGFSSAIRGTRLAEGASMGIHESQSRLWENIIGRGRPFLGGRFPSLKEAFPDSLAGVDAESFYKAVNSVRPTPIRVDADEVTYSLHVVLRFDLERRLFSGDLDVDALPDAWRSGMQSLVGVVGDSDAEGVLQDIHWSMGAFGYFPSYALGNLYGAMFWNQMRRDLDNIDDMVERGDFSPILEWLRGRVHRSGQSLLPGDLLAEVCSASLESAPFLRYLESKYADIYGF